MNLADELAKVVEKKVQIDEEYEEIWLNKIFGELWKFYSFLYYQTRDIKNKTFGFSVEKPRRLNYFKARIYFNGKYQELTKETIAFLVIKSDFDSKLLEDILANFCIGNNFAFEILSNQRICNENRN